VAEYTAGSASVPITPDLSDFHTRIAEELDTLGPKFEAAGDKSGKLFADAFSERVKEATAGLDISVKADADTTEAEAEIEALGKNETVKVQANADTTEAEAQLTALTKKSWTVKVKTVADKVSDKTGTLGLPEAAGIGALAVGPQAVGAAAGVAGIGVAFAAAAADAGAFGAVAKGMFGDVTTAQKNLTTAQQDYNKATTDAGRASALKAEQTALAGLTPSEKELATQLTAVSAGWKSFELAEQPVVEGALTPWLQTVTSNMGLLKPLVDDGANAIQALGSQAQTALQNPFWDKFSATFGQTGEDALTDFGEAAGSIGDGLAHLFVTFAPDIDKLLSDIPTLAGDFDTWAKGVKAGGLEDFFSKVFSPSNVKTLESDGKDLENLLENAAKASQDMSPLAFDGVSNVLDILGSLSPGEIEALTGLFLAIKTIGTISKGVSAVTGVVNQVKGLLGGASTTAEETAEGTAAGTAAGTSAATAFTSTFSAEVTAALPAAFTEIGSTGSVEAGTAGTAMGTVGATAFGVAFGAEDELGVTAALTAVGVSGAAEADVAGAAIGAAAAAGFAEGVGGVGAALGEAVAAGGILAAVGAGLAGAALGTAVGLGFNTALAATGVAGAAAKIGDDVKSATAQAGTWLTPAGQDTVKGYIAGFNSEQAAAAAAAGQLKGWVTAPNAGSSAWLSPSGQQAGQGFDSGFNSIHGAINSTAAQLRNWVTSALPAPASWLVNLGIDAAQGFANGLASGASGIYSEANSIASTVISTIANALDSASPSRETMKLGVYAGQGFGLGIGSQVPFVGEQASQLAMTSVQGLAGIAATPSFGALSALGVPSIGPGQRLPGVSGPVRSGGLQLQLSYAGTGNAVTDAIVGGLQVHIQGATGGDVQLALGQGPVRLP
jgi:hypothetical protein